MDEVPQREDAKENSSQQSALNSAPDTSLRCWEGESTGRMRRKSARTGALGESVSDILTQAYTRACFHNRGCSHNRASVMLHYTKLSRASYRYASSFTTAIQQHKLSISGGLPSKSAHRLSKGRALAQSRDQAESQLFRQHMA